MDIDNVPAYICMMIYNRPGQRRTPGLHSVKHNHIYGRSTMPNLTNNTIDAISSAATISFLFFRNAFDGKNEAFNAHYPTLLSDVMTMRMRKRQSHQP